MRAVTFLCLAWLAPNAFAQERETYPVEVVIDRIVQREMVTPIILVLDPAQAAYVSLVESAERRPELIGTCRAPCPSLAPHELRLEVDGFGIQDDTKAWAKTTHHYRFGDGPRGGSQVTRYELEWRSSGWMIVSEDPLMAYSWTMDPPPPIEPRPRH